MESSDLPYGKSLMLNGSRDGILEGVDGITLHHRALANPTRARLLEHLRASDTPRSVDELAAVLGLHPNTVRAHGVLLEEAGLVTSATERDGRPGRPRTLFTAVPDGAEEEHGLLAAALASALEPLPNGAEIAVAAGRSWGHVLVERLEPGCSPSQDVCIEKVASMLRRRGFVPARSPDGIVMNRCPFRDLAERYPRVVCSLHAGLVTGALEEIGAPVRLEALEPWVTPSTCLARLPGSVAAPP